MKVIDVYQQYFEGFCVANEVERHGVLVRLTATSDEGKISYEVGISFFPHRDPEDFGISYDAEASRAIYQASGRRSKKREEAFLAGIRPVAEALAGQFDGTIDWEKPLIEARRG